MLRLANDGVAMVKIKVIVEGAAESEAVVSLNPISFFGDIDPKTGVVKDPNSNIKGVSIAGKVLVVPGTRGSTVGSYVLYALSKNNVAPKAIVVKSAEPILITGCILGGIPLVTSSEDYLFNGQVGGKRVKIDPSSSSLEIVQ